MNRPDDPVEAALGLGGNLGDPPAAMATALRTLDGRPDTAVAAVSALYRTPPWGKTDQARFFNACALVRTALSPEALLDACLRIERGMKRVRGERWGPRTIDIDILYFGEEVRTGRLTLPHPRMRERAFVMVPLADIAAQRLMAGRTVAQWAAGLDRAGIEAVEDGRWWQRR